MLRIGLTGGLGCGKTTVMQAFAKLGVPVIDTDEISRQLTSSAGPALPKLLDAFGKAVFNADGTLNRKSLRSLILRDEYAKHRLESILHPMIQNEVVDQLNKSDGPYVLIVVPLLVETDSYKDSLDRILVVDCNEETQVQRAIDRGGWEESEIRLMIASQASRASRLMQADDVIENDGGLDDLNSQVVALNEKYRALARQRL